MSDHRGLQIANVFAVPGTGHSRQACKWLRGPRNIGVKRALLADLGTLKGQKFPPDNYDDVPRAAFHDRNWKRFRKTRWHRIARA